MAGWVDQVLPHAAFPDTDHRRRIRASFCLALAAMQLAASLLFAFAEFVAGHLVTAGIMLVGALLPLGPALRLRRDGNVARWSQVLIANMFSATIAANGDAVVVLNYTLQKYRDYKVGTYIFEKERDHLIEKGIKRIVYTKVVNKNHRQFLTVMGFRKEVVGSEEYFIKDLMEA